MEISSAIQTICTGSEYSPQTCRLCCVSIQTCLVSVEHHVREKGSQQLCSLAHRIRTVFLHTILCAFIQFWQAVDLQYFHLRPSFFKWCNWQCRVSCSSKLLLTMVTLQMIAYLTFPKSLCVCVSGSIHWLIISIARGFKKSIIELLMCLACARFWANCEWTLQGSLCLGLTVIKLYG